ncbi:MAG: selenocysteine-specific translation elongation factor [Fusobacterium sp.]|uniref:selenocysteine-specific translation elongation factor n=2 Tax=Fusobacterium TaxID=848 RepID=UPI0029422523|nr:selenocysteine-specific translation elongation factor [Fusobacterium sp.]MDY3059963.1 selenocysteine-specific translation elongation factor [Fusobacterium sp.]
MRDIIIGTAGHIDHGKTTLVEFLTDKNTDTLPEEKKRGLTIDIGFSYLQLGNNRVGIIDVPGHEKFIKNMVAGTSSIDYLILTIACDDGVMPQTIEHLNIASILGVKNGIVVLTKRDLIDKERLNTLKKEVAEFLKGSFLEDSQIIEVSFKDPSSFENLKNILSQEIKNIEIDSNKNRKFRLDIDRVFSVKGFGTVVTGTSKNSAVTIGDKLLLYPQMKEVIVKGIENHNNKVTTLEAGNRCALNIAGIEVKEIHRGNILAEKNSLFISDRIDCSFFLLPNSNLVKNNQRIHLNIGTTEVIGRIKIFGSDIILPNETAFIQIELEKSLVCNKGDRGLVRNFSPVITIGGIEILNPLGKKVKRKDCNYLENLKNLNSNRKDEQIESIVKNSDDLFLTSEKISLILGEKINSPLNIENIINIEENYYIHIDNLTALRNKVLEDLKIYHEKNRLALGINTAEIKSRYFKEIPNNIYQSFIKLLIEENLIKTEKNFISLLEFQPKLNKEEKKLKDQIFSIYKSFGFKPQNINKVAENFNNLDNFKTIHQFMVDNNFIIYLGEETYILKGFFLEAKKILISYLQKNPKITLGDFSKLLNSNRKISLLLLEKFDEEKITKRIDNYRILLSKGDGFND